MTPWVAVPLMRGGFALIDKRDAMRVCRHRWRRKGGAVIARIGGRDVRLSRFIVSPPRSARVRCISGERLDCRRENLLISGAARGC